MFLWRTLMALAALVDAPGFFLGILDQVLFIAYFAWSLWRFYRGRVRFLALRAVGGVFAFLIVGAALNVGLTLWAPR